jgi:hypothetical protein
MQAVLSLSAQGGERKVRATQGILLPNGKDPLYADTESATENKLSAQADKGENVR